MAQRSLAPPDLQDILLNIAEVAPVGVVARRLAEAALQLTDADYAALGAYNARHGLEQFATAGIGDGERDLIGSPPDGAGLLGEFARDPRTINVASVTDAPHAAGFPDGHPPMGPFLGVPVLYASEPIGALYVARRPGAPPFSGEEQERVERLAPYAAIALSNARTLEQEHARTVAAEALSEAARGLQQTPPERQTGEVLADALRAIFPDATHLAICWSGDPETRCHHPPRWSEDPLSAALDRFLTVTAEDGTHDPDDLLPEHQVTVQVGTLEGHGRLALAVGQHEPFTEVGRVALRTLTEIGAIGLMAWRRRDAEAALERYAVRDEIARDLHDDLIQSIYAVGLNLRGAWRSEASESQAALSKASDDLNSVIRDLRSYIAHLSSAAHEFTSAQLLAERINALLRDEGMQTPWSVDVQLGDRALGRQLERQLYLVVREAVSNVERHAVAQSASLSLRREGDTLHLEVTDDGVGFDRSTVSESSVGLRSIEERVAAVGGSIGIASTPGQGTSLIATFPVSEVSDG